MVSRWFGFVAASLLLAATLGAQEYNFSVYRQTNGLGNITVSGLAFDSSGFLWVGTENGLYRFLGDRFQRFGAPEGLEEREIQDVFAAPDGSLWVGTYGNLYRWDGTRFAPAGPHPIAIWNSQHLAAEAPGKLLVIDKNHLFRLTYATDGKTTSYLPVFPEAQVAKIPAAGHLAVVLSATDRDPAVWVGCEYGLCSWQDGKLAQFTASDGLPKEFVLSLIHDREGNLWAASEHHVSVLTPGAKRFLDRTPPAGDPNSVYRRTPLALDAQGRVLVSTAQGLARWNGAAWDKIGQANGLNSNYLTALTFDADRDLWMGSSGQGLYHWIGYSDWEGWTARQGLPSSGIWSLGGFNGNQAYFGTETGPARINLLTGKVEKLFRDPEWRYGQVGGMTQYSPTQLLAGSFSGAILAIDTGTLAVTPIGQLQDIVYNLVRDPAGRVFIATGGGVFLIPAPSGATANAPFRLKPQPVPEVNQSFGGKPPTIFNACIDSSGSAWFVTSSRVFGFQNGHWTFPEIAGFPPVPPQLDDLSCAADGSLWVTSQASGSWHLEWQASHWNASELPLPEEFRLLEPLAILSDRRGWLWIGTDDGLLAFNGQSWRHLTQESGLVWNDVDSSRLALGPDDSLWIGTSGGLGHLMHPASVFASLPVNVAITQARRGTRILPSVSGFTLPWSTQSIRFQFATPLAVNRGDLLFRYRIPEINSDWTTTAQSSVELQALPPGSYTLELLAVNSARGAQSALATASFRILPPWWRSNWFCALAAVLLFAILWLLYFLRTRHLMRMKGQLETQVRERTLELEASREEMRLLATHDSLTGLLNRSAILESLQDEMDRGNREGKSTVVVLADVDFFKEVNDTWGHQAGDAVLQEFALHLRSSIRSYDSVGRYGGEEFLLILTHLAPDEVPERLHQLHTIVSGRVVSHSGVQIQVHCSMGAVAIQPTDNPISPDLALAAADLALYEAKQTGRNRVVLRPAPNRERVSQTIL